MRLKGQGGGVTHPRGSADLVDHTGARRLGSAARPASRAEIFFPDAMALAA